MIGAAVGMAARTMYESNSSPAESDLEAGIYNQRMAMLAVGGEEATVELSETSAFLWDAATWTVQIINILAI